LQRGHVTRFEPSVASLAEPAFDASVQKLAFVGFAENFAQGRLNVGRGNASATQLVQDSPVPLLATGGALESKLTGKASIIKKPFAQKPSHHLPGKFGWRPALLQILFKLEGGVTPSG
jgi:hypothetical protein